MDRGRLWLQTANRWRCVYLLVFLVALLALYPHLLGEADEGETLFSTLFSLVMLAGLYSVSRNRWQFGLAALLLVPSMVGNWTAFHGGGRLALTCFTAAFFTVMAALVLRYVFAGRTHVGDRLCGALSVYLLMGMAFAQVYEAAYTANPGSFLFGEPALARFGSEWTRFLYLSFVTQTTLGYGDITPATTVTESLTILQSASGVLYIAVLVAWLVGSIRPATSQNDAA